MNRKPLGVAAVIAALSLAACGGAAHAPDGGKAFAQRYLEPLRSFLSSEDAYNAEWSIERAYNAYERAKRSTDAQTREQAAKSLAEPASTAFTEAWAPVTHPTTYEFTQDSIRQLALLPPAVRVQAAGPPSGIRPEVAEEDSHGAVSATQVIKAWQARFPELRAEG